MTRIQLPFRAKTIELDCEEPDTVQFLAAEYNKRLERFGNEISDAKVALFVGIEMQHELQRARDQLTAQYREKFETELAEAFNQIASCLNAISEKLEKQ